MSRNLSLSTAQRFPAKTGFNSHVLGLRPSYMRIRVSPTTPDLPQNLDTEPSHVREEQTIWDSRTGRLQLHPHAGFNFPKLHVQLLVEHQHPSTVGGDCHNAGIADHEEDTIDLPESVVKAPLQLSAVQTLALRSNISPLSSPMKKGNSPLPVAWSEGVSMINRAVNPEKLLMDSVRLFNRTGRMYSVVVPCDEQLAGSLKGIATIYPHRFFWRSFDLNFLEAALLSPTSVLSRLQPNGDWGTLRIEDFEAENLPRVRFFALTPIVDPRWDLDLDALPDKTVTKSIAAVLYSGSDMKSGRLKSLPSLLSNVREDVVMPYLTGNFTVGSGRGVSMEAVAASVGWGSIGPRLRVGVEAVVDTSVLNALRGNA